MLNMATRLCLLKLVSDESKEAYQENRVGLRQVGIHISGLQPWPLRTCVPEHCPGGTVLLVSTLHAESL